MRSAASGLVPFALMLVATGARADDVTPPEAPPVASTTPTTAPAPRMVSHWYGWQTLLVDGAAIAVASASGQSAAFGYTGVGLYAFGGPLIHVIHDRAGIGAADLGVRIGGPFVLGLIGMGVELAATKPNSCGGDLCFRGLAGFAVGFFIGYVTAVVLDAAVFAREKIPADEVASSRRRPLVQLVPMLSLTPTGASAGIGGTM